MSAADQGPAGSSLTREQVLDELELLAKVGGRGCLLPRASLEVRSRVMEKSWLRRVSDSRAAPSV